MSPKKINFPNEKSNRIILFADLRDSTDILVNFHQGLYQRTEATSGSHFTYEKFIFNLDVTLYKVPYLGHENTYAEIQGDGIMGVFPEDNTKYILENIYRLTTKMRVYNESAGIVISRPRVDIGFGITLGRAAFAYYPLDERQHPVGQCIHEAARIETVSKFYDARILISHQFFNFAQGFLNSDQRFSYRFIDRVILKGLRDPLTLYEILIDNDPRFELKKNSVPLYETAYSKYCEKKWKDARDIFLKIYKDYGLGVGAVMAQRCDLLDAGSLSRYWDGIWSLKEK